MREPARGRSFVVLARLREGATFQQVRAEMETIGDRLERADPTLNHGWRPSVYTLRDELTGECPRAAAGADRRGGIFCC